MAMDIDNLNQAPVSFYVTKDLTEASSLITCGHPVCGMRVIMRGGGRKAVGHFQFRDTDDMRADRDMYNSGRLMVEPRTFQANLRQLKSKVECALNDTEASSC